MTDKKKPGQIIGFSDRKEIKCNNDEEQPEINEALVESLEDLLKDAKEGNIQEGIFVVRHEDCGLFHPYIMCRQFKLDMYGMLHKLHEIYEDVFYVDYEE